MQSGERERAGSSKLRVKNSKQDSTDSDTEPHGGGARRRIAGRLEKRQERRRGRGDGGLSRTGRAARYRWAGMSDEASTAASRGTALVIPSWLLGRSFRQSTPWRRASLPLGVKSAEHRLERPAPSANLAVSPPRVRPTRRYNHRVSTSPWPSLRDEDRWLIAAMEDQLRDSTQSPEQLQARAGELRAQAEQSDIKGVRDASLALAGRYEDAAAARLAAR